MRTVLLAVLTLEVASGQEYFRHNISVGMGAALPRGDLRPLFSDSFLVGVQYGYRFHPNFQLDVGFDGVFGAAGVRDWLPTAFGNLRIRDFQTFVPFGGRAILPLYRDKIEVYGGLGGAYIRYGERIRQPFQNVNFRIPCDICASRDGFGYYGLFGVTTALDELASLSSRRRNACVPRLHFRRPVRSRSTRRNDGPVDHGVRFVQRILLNYLISLLVTVAGSAPQFSRITRVWSEKNVRRPVFPNTSGTAVT